jgi:acetyl-CoA acetyltransferase
LIGTKEMGEAMGLKPRARIKAFAEIGSEPTIMLTGPEFVAAKALKRAGMSVDDIDLYELNEAFAAQGLAVLRKLELDETAPYINPNGGAIALGHPLGMSGARITGSAALDLHEHGGRLALATMCIGVGQGISIALERV